MRTVKTSIYQQIIEEVKRRIACGVLQERERLPSCRDLAIRLGVNPNTVQRAYSALEEEGVIYTLPKKGVYVAEGAHKSPDELFHQTERDIKEKLAAWKEAGVPAQTIYRLTDEIYGDDHDSD